MKLVAFLAQLQRKALIICWFLQRDSNLVWVVHLLYCPRPCKQS